MLNRIAKNLYVLGLLLALGTIAGVPLHALGTATVTIRRVLPDRFEVADGGQLSVGARVPVFRYSNDWRSEIGHGQVVQRRGNIALVAYDADDFIWPLGQQGTILSTEGRRVQIDIGQNVDLLRGDILFSYDGVTPTGRLRVERVSEESALAVVTGGAARPGQVVTPFSVVNRVSWFGPSWAHSVEWLAIGALLALWLWSAVSPLPGKALGRCGAALRSRVSNLGPRARLAGAVLLAPLVIVVVGRVGWNTLTYLSFRLLELAHFAPSEGLRPFHPKGLPYAYVAVGVAYFGWLLRKQGSPITALWRALARPPEWMNTTGIPRALVLWVMHLTIFYAFGSTLTEFLRGNFNAICTFAYPGQNLSFNTVHQAKDAIEHMLAHPVTWGPPARTLSIARYALWSLTILGCLLGYLHAVASISWKVSIRNVDFTLTGWIVNGICYGPLLGMALHQSLPQAAELVPAVSDGPWMWLAALTELLLNVLYTLSIWNLGTMFGVMVDKGVRRTGFYSVVRHPSYTLEGLMFVMLLLPGLSSPALWLAALAYPIKYWLRSERDDVFMSGSNPEYADYQKQVPNKLVPGLY